MNTVINSLKMLSDENRLRILNIIKDDALCVGEIQTLLALSQSNVSRHLEKLKISSMVTYEKQAQWIIYKLSDDAIAQYPFIKQLLFNDIKDIDIFTKDLQRLKKYKSSKLTCHDLRALGFDYSKIDFSSLEQL